MTEYRFPPEFHPLNQVINKAVLDAAEASGCKVYLVGGYIRDALLGRFNADSPPRDFDYTVLGKSAIGFAREVESKMDGNFVLLDESNDTARVVLHGGIQIDFAGCVGGALESDIRRRDLTINALLWDPAHPDTIRDEVGGLKDLSTKTVRAISEQSLTDDPLRLLRVFRFAAVLGFSIDPQTLTLVRKHADLLNKIAAERISYELFCIMESGRAAQTIKLMAECAVLEVVFPELRAMHRVPPNSYHHLGLFDHSLEVLRQTELGLKDMPEWTRSTFDMPLSYGVTKYGATKMAALLHDVAKPDTWVVAEDGRHTFIGHDKLGAEMCDEISKRLKWSVALEKFISNLVRWHLRPGALFHQGLPTDRAVNRFYSAVGDSTPQLILLALGDFRGTCGPGLQENRELLENQLRELLERYAVFVEGSKKLPPLLDGHQVCDELHIPPGPPVGELLKALREAQLLGEVANKAEGVAFVKKLYAEKYSEKYSR
jgi:putative nucleotidyltransferase with HDIG domain